MFPVKRGPVVELVETTLSPVVELVETTDLKKTMARHCDSGAPSCDSWCQPMNSCSSLRSAAFGLAPTMDFTTSPFW